LVHLVSIGKRLALLLGLVAVYCVAVGLIIRRWELRGVEFGSAASAVNSLILSLLMGFRNRAAYDRWWEGRQLWGQLTNDTRNLAAKLAAFLPADVLARSRVAVLLVGFAEALKLHLRGAKPRLPGLPGFEGETEDPPHVPLYLTSRLYAVLADWKREGRLDQDMFLMLDAHLRGQQDVCGACERIRNTPLSPSYKALLRTGLLLNVLAEPWLTMQQVGFVGVPVFLMFCFFLFGAELIDTVIEEPFGTESEDLDLDRYCRTIRDSVQATLPGLGRQTRPFPPTGPRVEAA
jgi:putative membrane protein